MFKEWKSDLKSSLVVFLVALPLCLGIALASNAPMSAGLFAGIIGGIVVGAISGSHVGVSGPAAGLTVIVLNGISTLGSFEIFAVAVFLAGIFQIIFGLIRAGMIGNYFPTAVIRGMLAAIGLILIIKQYPNALGLSKNGGGIQYGILIISAISIGLMLFWDKMAYKGIKFFQLIPGALVAVACAILANTIYQSYFPELALGKEYLVQLPFHGGLSEIFSMVKFPDFSHIFDKSVIQIALTIAIVASLETLLCVDAGDKIDPEKRVTSKDRELFAQGIGNTLSGLVGGLPITAVIVRTSANIAAGNKTKLSAILHGVWLIGCVALIPMVLNLIPLACLACVLLLVGYKLCKPVHFLDMKKRGWDQLIIFCSTIIAIIATDLLVGIFVGIVVAVMFELNKLSRRPFTISHESEKSVLEFTKNVAFFHKPQIHKAIASVPAGMKVHILGLKNVKVHVDVHELILEHKNVEIK
jgi:MFS superfamily sulfate permease-like transporter